MPATKDFDETVRERIQTDPAFRAALLIEALDLDTDEEISVLELAELLPVYFHPADPEVEYSTVYSFFLY